jgi:hypothetical protein
MAESFQCDVNRDTSSFIRLDHETSLSNECCLGVNFIQFVATFLDDKSTRHSIMSKKVISETCSRSTGDSRPRNFDQCTPSWTHSFSSEHGGWASWPVNGAIGSFFRVGWWPTSSLALNRIDRTLIGPSSQFVVATDSGWTQVQEPGARSIAVDRITLL